MGGLGKGEKRGQRDQSNGGVLNLFGSEKHPMVGKT